MRGTAEAILEEMRRTNGWIKHDVLDKKQDLFDPAVGNPQTGEQIDSTTFNALIGNGWIETTDTREIRRYRISQAGVARLATVRPTG
jgi:hypothetical protein